MSQPEHNNGLLYILSIQEVTYDDPSDFIFYLSTVVCFMLIIICLRAITGVLFSGGVCVCHKIT